MVVLGVELKIFLRLLQKYSKKCSVKKKGYHVILAQDFVQFQNHRSKRRVTKIKQQTIIKTILLVYVILLIC